MSDVPDLLAAAVAWLRGAAELVAAFGDDPSSPATTKFWADRGEGLPDLPYLVFEEVDELLEYEADGDDVGVNAEGHVEAHVFAGTKLQARRLGELVARTLRDAPLAFDGGELLQLRPSGQWFEEPAAVSIGTPVEFHRIIEFRYLVSRS